jgi:hypothetical protein
MRKGVPKSLENFASGDTLLSNKIRQRYCSNLELKQREGGVHERPRMVLVCAPK